MDIILLERVESLGQMGDVVSVRPGFARNFLLPQKKALRATKANREMFERQKSQLVAQSLERRKEAEKLAKKVDGMNVIITRQAGETGMLYGSVNSRDIAVAITDKGIKMDRQQVAIDQPIKMLGLFPIRVILHPEVTVKITVNVARNEEEAAIQAKTGAAVVLAEATPQEKQDQNNSQETAA